MDKLATIQKELLDGLDILASLESNWDGYNASKFDKKTIDNGKYLLDLIFQKHPSFAQKIKDIFIEPATNSVIYFKIEYDGTELQKTSIGIGTEHVSSYSKFRHNHPSLGRDLKCDELDDFVKELLDVIVNNK
jgi:hypothetical protein